MWIDDDQDNESGQEINDKDYVVKVYKTEDISDEEDGTKDKDLSKKKIGLSIRRFFVELNRTGRLTYTEEDKDFKDEGRGEIP